MNIFTLRPDDYFAAIEWLETADEKELAAFEAFKKEGCKSCGKKAHPACSCWSVKKHQYMKDGATS